MPSSGWLHDSMSTDALVDGGVGVAIAQLRDHVPRSANAALDLAVESISAYSIERTERM